MTPIDRMAHVDEVRNALLSLHKAMIDTQRIDYERTHGRVSTTQEFLGLVLNHPDFEWIRELSALIAQLDEWREEAEAASDQELEDLLSVLRDLTRANGPDVEFGKRYWAMIDAAPDVLMAHVKLAKLLGD